MPVLLKSWGTNSHGQLGLQTTSEQEANPVTVGFDQTEKIVDISCGGSHTLILTAQGLFSAGLNDRSQLGRKTEKKYDAEFTTVDVAGEEFAQICAGWDFSIARTKHGDVYGWGSNQFGQLGNMEKVVPVPTRIPELSSAASLTAGTRFSAVISEDGSCVKVFGKVDRGASSGFSSHLILECPSGAKFVSFASGSNHFYALDNQGNIWTYGCNKFGQRGRNNTEEKLMTLKFELQEGDKVKELKSGWTSGIFLTNKGFVHTWGRNNYGQLGRSTTEQVDAQVKLVEELENIKQIAAGSEHMLALTSEGELKAWGWNEHGNCGNGKTEDIKQPVSLFPHRKRHIIGIWNGHGHNFLLIAEPTAYRVEILSNGYAIDEGDHFKANATCSLITGPKKVIVDTMTPWDGPFILEELRKRCLQPEDINYVVSTHGHSDHIGNNNLFLNALHIVGYCVSKKDLYWMHPFDSGEAYFIDGENLAVIPTPGHTADDISVIVKTEDLGTIAIAGDIFERKEDINDQSIWNSAGSADPEKQARSRMKIASVADYIVPGHGPMFKVTDEMKSVLKSQLS